MDCPALVAMAALERHEAWTMTLTNPTLQEIDAAVAEKVARMTGPFAGSDKWIDNETNNWVALPAYSISSDAVLPLVHQWLNSPETRSAAIYRSSVDGMWRVTLRAGLKYSSEIPEWTGLSEEFSTACAIALLRAHGVEVGFTK